MQKIIFSTNSSEHLSLDNGEIDINRFPDGEVRVVLSEDVAGREIVVIGSTEPPAENFLELSFTLHRIVADGARKITVIIPYFGYSRGDREAKAGEAVTAEAVSKMLVAVGGKNLEIIIIDPHSPKISGFFDIPFKEISLTKDLASRFPERKDLTVVAPDSGALARAGRFAKACGIDGVVNVVKERLAPDRVKIKEIRGEVGTSAVIVDDMVQTGETILKVAKELKEAGAQNISVAATHMVYCAGGWKRLADSELIDRVVTTNTIKPLDDLPTKFELINIASVLKEVVQ